MKLVLKLSEMPFLGRWHGDPAISRWRGNVSERPSRASSGRGPKESDSVNAHVLSNKIHWQVTIGFCRLGPFCHRSSARKTHRYHWRDSWKIPVPRPGTGVTGRAQHFVEIFNVERACVHVKQYVECKSTYNTITPKQKERGE